MSTSQDRAAMAVTSEIEPIEKGLGGLTVRRALPAPRRRMVGPFIFFDHFGPAQFPPGEGIQVRPHPHIGLATISWLFDGTMIHRDSLGFVQPIKPGEVNLMTAGRGIVHSERAGDDLHTASTLHGIQSWMAMPAELEESDPAFVHYPADSLPRYTKDGVEVTVIIGQDSARLSPVEVSLPMLYLQCRMPAGTSLTLPGGYEELGAYLVSGDVAVDAQRYAPGRLLVLRNQPPPSIEALSDSVVMAIGGATPGARHIYWNFVSSSRERIERAKRDWRAGHFAQVPGETEFIPLPDE